MLDNYDFDFILRVGIDVILSKPLAAVGIKSRTYMKTYWLVVSHIRWKKNPHRKKIIVNSSETENFLLNI